MDRPNLLTRNCAYLNPFYSHPPSTDPAWSQTRVRENRNPFFQWYYCTR